MPVLADSKQHSWPFTLLFRLQRLDATLDLVSTSEGTFARQTASRAVETLTRTLRGPQRPLEALEALRHAEWLTSWAAVFWIDAARRSGATWEQIADARGTTHQNESAAARRRAAEKARDPFDQWLDRRRAQLLTEERFRRRHGKTPGAATGSTGVNQRKT